VECLSCDAEAIILVVSTHRPAVPCPDCGRLAGRIHSRYTRTAADLPWNGVRVRLRVRSRKFFCDYPDCPRVIFCERLPGLIKRYARRTERLAQALQWIGYALGGEAGARVAAILGLGVSPATLLRLLRARTPGKVAAPRVLGVDDWALRKGHRYGSILVDLEASRVIDLLPDRQTDTLAAWLRNHPGVQRVCRDRSGAYAEGARQGAPHAGQSADRWHLLHNLAEALEAVVSRHRGALRQAASKLAVAPSEAAMGAGRSPPATAAPKGSAGRRKGTSPLVQQRRVRRQQVHRLYRAGYTQTAIAALVGVDRDTVHHDLQAIARRGGRRPLAQPYARYLEDRWRAGCHNGAQLWREIVSRGFTGAYDAVDRFLRPWRAEMPAPSKCRGGKRQRQATWGPIPTPRRVTWWLLTDPEERSQEERAFLDQLRTDCPSVLLAQQLVSEFFRIVRKRDLPALEPWIEQATASGLSELRSRASGLRGDWDAVAAALTYSHSNGPVEGHVNRLKLIKRQMYGRAGLDLLRARVLPINP